MTDAPTEVDIPVQVDQGSIYYDDIIDLDETESKEGKLIALVSTLLLFFTIHARL